MRAIGVRSPEEERTAFSFGNCIISMGSGPSSIGADNGSRNYGSPALTQARNRMCAANWGQGNLNFILWERRGVQLTAHRATLQNGGSEQGRVATGAACRTADTQEPSPLEGNGDSRMASNI